MGNRQFKNDNLSLAYWLTPVIPATQKVEIRRITVQGQSLQKVQATASQPIKAGYSGTHLSSQIQGRYR
jgi:hypothetical protein